MANVRSVQTLQLSTTEGSLAEENRELSHRPYFLVIADRSSAQSLDLAVIAKDDFPSLAS